MCDEFNWNNALANFNFLLFNPVFVTESQFLIKTADESSGVSPDNGGS